MPPATASQVVPVQPREADDGSEFLQLTCGVRGACMRGARMRGACRCGVCMRGACMRACSVCVACVSAHRVSKTARHQNKRPGHPSIISHTRITVFDHK